MAEPKKNDTEKVVQTGMGLSLKTANPDAFPIAYDSDVWDTVEQGSELANVVGTPGQYDQHIINEALAGEIANNETPIFYATVKEIDSSEELVFPAEMIDYDDEHNGKNDKINIPILKYDVVEDIMGLQFPHNNDTTSMGPNCAVSEEFFTDDVKYIYNQRTFTAVGTGAPLPVDSAIHNIKAHKKYTLIINGTVYPASDYDNYSTSGFYVVKNGNNIYVSITSYPDANTPAIYITSLLDETPQEGEEFTITIYEEGERGGVFFVASGNTNTGKIFKVDTNTFNYNTNEGTFDVETFIQLDTTKIQQVLAVRYCRQDDVIVATGYGLYAAIVKNVKTTKDVTYVQISQTLAEFYHLDVLDEDNFVFGARNTVGIGVYKNGTVYNQYVWRCSTVKYIDGIPFAAVQSYGDSLPGGYSYHIAKWKDNLNAFVSVLSNGKSSAFSCLGKFNNLQYSGFGSQGLYYACTYQDKKIFCSQDSGETWVLTATLPYRITSAIDYSDKERYPVLYLCHGSQASYVGKIDFFMAGTMNPPSYNYVVAETKLGSTNDIVRIVALFDDNKFLFSHEYLGNTNPMSLGYATTEIETLDKLINSKTEKIFLTSEWGDITIGNVNMIGYALLNREYTDGILTLTKPKNYYNGETQKIDTIIIDIDTETKYIQKSAGHDDGYFRWSDKFEIIEPKEIPTKISDLENDSDYEEKSNKVVTITSESTNTQYPSAKAVFEALANIDLSALEQIANKVTSINAQSTDTQYPSAKLLYDKLQALATIFAPIVHQHAIADLTNPGALFTQFALNNGIVNLTIGGQLRSITIPTAGTPSGDPLHYVYVKLGCTYNTTTGKWTYKDLTDLTTEEVNNAYVFTAGDRNQRDKTSLYRTAVVRFNFEMDGTLQDNLIITCYRIFQGNQYIECAYLASAAGYGYITIAGGPNGSPFYNCSKLKKIGCNIRVQNDNIPTNTTGGYFQKNPSLQFLHVFGVKNNFFLNENAALQLESIVYIVTNATNTTAITFGLHANAYARCVADTTQYTYNGNTYTGILALASAKNITIASA